MSSCNYFKRKKTMKINSYFVSRYISDDTIRVSWALMFNTIDVCHIIIPLQTS